MLVEEKIKNKKGRNSLVLVSSFILIIIGFSCLLNQNLSNYKEEKINEQKIDNFINNMSAEETSLLPIEDKNITEEYIAVLEIPSINLRRGIYSKDSKENTIEKNVALMKESDLPDTIYGNVILASHSGTAKIAYFNNLSKLKFNDIAYIYFNGTQYTYYLVKSYEADKTGEVSIFRNLQKNTLTLITCKNKENKHLIFVFEQ